MRAPAGDRPCGDDVLTAHVESIHGETSERTIEQNTDRTDRRRPDPEAPGLLRLYRRVFRRLRLKRRISFFASARSRASLRVSSARSSR